jgi:hypothetical protein
VTMYDDGQPKMSTNSDTKSTEAEAGGIKTSSRRRRVIRAAPSIARLGAFVWWRTAEWTVETVARTGTQMVRSAAAGEPPTKILREASEEARTYARRLLGILDTRDGDGPDDRTPPSPEWDATPPPEQVDTERRRNGMSLRERGAELLRRSADVHYEEDRHPAYERILEDLAPDEGRILRLLAQDGPQPSVDVRSGVPLASTLVAPGLTMIGAEAGCRHLDRVPSYLHNLFRLGLVWFSRERLEDTTRYQVLEAQPDVVESLEAAGRTGRTVRRSIHLTAFGKDFCEVCLPLETGELEALPGGRRAKNDRST